MIYWHWPFMLKKRNIFVQLSVRLHSGSPSIQPLRADLRNLLATFYLDWTNEQRVCPGNVLPLYCYNRNHVGGFLFVFERQDANGRHNGRLET